MIKYTRWCRAGFDSQSHMGFFTIFFSIIRKDVEKFKKLSPKYQLEKFPIRKLPDLYILDIKAIFLVKIVYKQKKNHTS